MDRKEDGSLLQNLLSSVCTVPDAEDIMSEDRTPGTGHSGRFVRGSPPCLLFSACCKAGGSLHLKPTEGFLRMVGVPRASKTGRAVPGSVSINVAGPQKSSAISKRLFCPPANQPTLTDFSPVFLVYIVSVAIRMVCSDCFLLMSTSIGPGQALRTVHLGFPALSAVFSLLKQDSPYI